MAKRTRLPMCPQDERQFNEGRGQGDRGAYRPWVSDREKRRSGFSTRLKGVVTGRDYHFRTDGETDYFRILDLCPQIRDIKEAYPLSLDTTVMIAKECDIPHPQHAATGAYRVMTTNFLITIVEGVHIRHVARSYATSDSLQRTEVLHAYDIVRQYWALQHLDWGIVTERDVPPTLIANARLIHGSYHAANVEFDYDGSGVQPLPHTLIRRIAAILTPEVLLGQTALNVLTAECDERLGMKPGISLTVAKHLLAQREWPVDFMRPLEPWAPVPLLQATVRQEKESTTMEHPLADERSRTEPEDHA